ncbi:MAG: EAL domain-containing protein [Micavibrio sp.]|nr:EAL domain-containing protein [Micavibrio sp.]
MSTNNPTSPKLFAAGDLIIKQGEKGTGAYILESGKVEITINTPEGEQKVGTRGPGAMLGEMAILDSKPRTANVRALEDCSMLEITRDNFTQRLEEADPVIRLAIQVILTRYRDLLGRAQVIDPPESGSIESPEALEHSFVRDSNAVDSLKLASEFEGALKDRQVSLHYQPIIDFKNEKVCGFEALMRWEHPERGFISPGVFIPVLEDSGMIVKASQWALQESLMALKRIETRAGYDNDLFMSVNFSSHDFSSDGFVDSIYETISKSDMQPSQLHVEITERLLMGQPEKALETLEMCTQAGIHISIDDFGTGYSSLSYLHAYPINTLKIDRSFVMKIAESESARELVRSVVALGHNLKMNLIAEGVETEEERSLLADMGCNMAQGYFFAKPMPEKDIVQFLIDKR